MKALVIYQSLAGNTRHVAGDVGLGLIACRWSVCVRSMDDVCATDFNEIDLLVVGTPARTFTRSSRPLQRWIDRVPDGAGRAAAVFETRVGWTSAGRMADQLQRELRTHGWSIVVSSTSFHAKSAEGPMVWGEHGHAQAWAAEVARAAGGVNDARHQAPGVRGDPA